MELVGAGQEGERRVCVTVELHIVGMSTTDAPLHPAEEPESLRQAPQQIRNYILSTLALQSKFPEVFADPNRWKYTKVSICLKGPNYK